MALLTMRNAGGYLAFDEEECRVAGRSLRERYSNAAPFPSIVIEDFLDPDLLRRVAAAYPASEGKTFFNRPQERLKYQYQPHESGSALVRNLLAELNSRAFLAFVEEMTGISGLIADPYFEGAGLHETKSGGHLSVHADFNLHPVMKVERRLNLLIYLNDDWPTEYGGNLELWDKAMKHPDVSIAPQLGRAVVFATNLDSFHGQPDPVQCPPDRSRKSIATYYYTALEHGVASIPERTTTFQVRPGTADTQDRTIRREHFLKDWVPPKLLRTYHKIRGWS